MSEEETSVVRVDLRRCIDWKGLVKSLERAIKETAPKEEDSLEYIGDAEVWLEAARKRPRFELVITNYDVQKM